MSVVSHMLREGGGRGFSVQNPSRCNATGDGEAASATEHCGDEVIYGMARFVEANGRCL